MSKSVVIVPIKQKSERVKGKNLLKFGKKKLYEITLEKLKFTNFDEIFVDTDSDEIKEYCYKNNINIINRLKKLSKRSANGNDLLNYHYQIIKSDIYFQIFITSPLLEVSTINKCLKILKINKNIDSILTMKKIYSWFWFGKKPVNYNPRTLPRSQDAEPIIQESTGLYGIKSSALKKFKCRIGKKPFFYFINEKEAFDLDTEEDLKYLKFITNKN
jgi:CMP-N-acetylneuraminic acid synthetase